ncbi:MAG: hypothetical protein GC154_14630 [bacterium]|nr:hypothetical protein [bacterium]
MGGTIRMATRRGFALRRLIVATFALTLASLAASAVEPVTLADFPTYVRSCVFSPDGEKVIASDDAGLIQIWDWRSETLIHQFKSNVAGNDLNYPGFAYGATFTPNGAEIAFVSPTAAVPPSTHTGNAVQFWDANTYQFLREFELGFLNTKKLNFSPDSTKLVTEGEVDAGVYDVQTGTQLSRLQTSDQSDVIFARYSPSGDVIVTGQHTSIFVWDANTYQLITELQEQRGDIDDAVFSPSGDRLYTLGYDGIIEWDMKSYSRLKFYPLGNSGGVNLFLDSRGNRICVFKYIGVFQWIELSTGEMVLYEHDPIQCGQRAWAEQIVDIHPDGEHIVTGSEDGLLRIWDFRAGQLPPNTPSQTVDLIDYNTFSGEDAASNGVVLFPGGFSGFPSGTIAFGEIDRPLPKRQPPAPSDGRGVKITVGPGEVMTFVDRPFTANSQTSVSCFVKVGQTPSQEKDLSISIGVIPDDGSNKLSIATYSELASYFTDYRLITSICAMNKGVFRPVVQVANGSSSETHTVYIDNLWVHALPTNSPVFRFSFEQTNSLLSRRYPDDPFAIPAE